MFVREMSSVRCPKCGSGNVLGVAGEWECFDCGYKFRLVSGVVAPPVRPTPARTGITPQARPPPPAIEKAPVVRKELSTGKILVLFMLGFFFAILVFPIAFTVSAGLGYILGIIAIIFSTILMIKKGGRTLPLALGVLLLVISLLSITGTAIIHIGAYTVAKVVEEVTRTETVEVGIRTPIRADKWEIVIEEVLETAYIRSGESFYGAEEGMKLILIRLKIKNLGKEMQSVSDVWDFTLVTNLNKSHENTYPVSIKWIFMPSEEVKAQAIGYRKLETTSSVAPSTYIEGDILFQIPINEIPEVLYFKVGIISPTQARIKLS